ncbi:hypothetical protein [Kitasatospora sp. NPDC088134]|uniref:hypothetical protein n=1 Tax=Kitasatospora sp. NPDC088134 TaxID=3364071 RepID=UPI003812B317
MRAAEVVPLSAAWKVVVEMSEKQPDESGAAPREKFARWGPGALPPEEFGSLPGRRPMAVPPTMIVPKSPGVAVPASFFLPGLGSMFSGNGGKGALILVLWLVSSFFWWLLFLGLLAALGFWIWGMVQGYNNAVAWNRRHGLIS